MATIQVSSGERVSITSTTHASAKQRFKVFRRLHAEAEWVHMDTVQGGGGIQYGAFNIATTYLIVCEGFWESARPTDWMRSREKQETKSPQKTIVYCEDYWSTDNDWNDLIVTINTSRTTNLKESKFGKLKQKK